MKASLFVSLAATALLTATSAFAAPTFDHDGPRDQPDNYGYARDHRLTREEAARWEATHRPQSRAGRPQAVELNRNRRVAHDEPRRQEQHDGFDRDHHVTRAEQAREEVSHRH